MKLIDCTVREEKASPLQDLWDRVRALLPFGQGDRQAFENVLTRFQRGLDNRFTVLRGLTLPGTGEAIPLILVGPSGLAAINVSTQKGIFRAKDDSWWEMNKTVRRFQPAHKNLLKQTISFARGLGSYLDVQGRKHPEVMPVLVFAHPGVHVDSSRPAVRIVLADGVDRLVINFQQAEEVINVADARLIDDTLERVFHPMGEKLPEKEEDFFGKDLIQPEAKKKAAPRKPIPVPQLDIPLPPSVAKSLQFSKKQWLVLGVLVVLSIITLVGWLLLVLFTT